MSHVEEAEGAALVHARRARVHRARLLSKLRGGDEPAPAGRALHHQTLSQRLRRARERGG
ncbi:MAG: hypothetical protein CBD47_04120 [Synechococcus sp. TMED187]|nr:MAG: hypothetical protein CBD47_04120 [Synechococcus sp. TMED187]